MSSLLRSANYFRQYLNLNRSLISAVSSSNFSRNSIRNQVGPAFSVVNRNYSLLVDPDNLNFDNLLDKLDNTVKRTSRVNKLDVDLAIQYINNNHAVTSSQALLVLRCCGAMLPEELPKIRTKMVEQLWETFKNAGVKFDISHYNALLKVYLENEHKFSPTEFLANLEKSGIQPNRVTFQRLIAHYCQVGDIAGATKILEYMKEKQLPINEQVFNSLILGHSQNNDLESAEGIVSMMKESGIKPSNETYTTLMAAYAKTGNIDKINELIAHCEKMDLILSDQDYLEVAYALAVNGHKDLIPQVLSRVRRVLDYNQDAINTILRLIAAGQEDAGYEIYKTMNKSIKTEEGSGSAENSSDGNFFVRQLVRCKRPLDKIKQYTETIAHENSNPYVHLVAVRCALKEGNAELAKDLLKYAEEKGFPIRAHYFWPLIKYRAHQGDVEGIYNVLAMMIQDFNIYQLRETTRDNLVWDLLKNGESWRSILERITALGVPSGTVASALVFNLLARNEIQEAAQVVENYRAYYQPYFIRPPLVKAFFRTGDLDSFLTILRAMYLSVQRQEEFSESTEDAEDSTTIVPDKRAMMNKTVYEVLSSFNRRATDTSKIEEFLKGLLDNGLGISEECGNKIQSWIKPNLTPELANIIERLTSEDLEPVPLALQRGGNTAHDERTLEQLAETLSRKGKPNDGVKVQLFQFYCRNKQLEKALQIKKEFEESGKTFNVGNYALLTDLYISLEDDNKAMEVLEFLKKDDPDFALDYGKTVKLATLLVQKDRIDDAVQLLEKYPVEEKKSDESLYLQNTLCFKLLNTAGEKGDTELVQKFFDLLTSKHFVEVTNVLLGPFIKSYLNRDDLKGALEKFEYCCQTYNCTPLKSELMVKFIELEDAASLQKITDLSTEVHGEANSLYDLMAAFLEVGRIRQARKILETPGLRIRQDRLALFSRKYAQNKDEEGIQKLLEVTRGINNIDRSIFYLHNLEIYAEQNDVEKAYGLWTEMQEEDEAPSDEFLIKLAQLLKKNNREVPFAVPDAPVREQERQKPERAESEGKTVLRRFRNYIQSKDLSQAMIFKDHPSIPPAEKSALVELLVQEKQMNEAKKIVLSMLQKGTHPRFSVFRYFLQELSQAGDTEGLEEVGKYTDKKIKREVYYLPKLIDAYRKMGRIEEYLKQLESTVENAVDSEDLRSIYPLRTVFRAVFEEPHILPHVEAVAKKIQEKNLIDGDITLWNTYFALNINPEEQEKLQKSLSQSENMYFVPVLKQAENTNDLALVERLKPIVMQETNTPRVNEKKGIVISAELRILTREDRIKEAFERLEAGLKIVDISHIRVGPLITLKRKAGEQNIPFNYTIPEKTAAHDDDESIHRASTQ